VADNEGKCQVGGPSTSGSAAAVGEGEASGASDWYYEVDVVVPHVVVASLPFAALLLLRRWALGRWR
jgi:hypothetical protein